MATSKEVLELAQHVKWQDIKLSSGDVVPAETIRAIFKNGATGVKQKQKRSRAHANDSATAVTVDTRPAGRKIQWAMPGISSLPAADLRKTAPGTRIVKVR